jgi:hypothetical protein
MTKDEQGYNGWTNYETWNVALWIGGDEGLYSMAKDYRHQGYRAFADSMRELGEDCGDGAAIYRETPDSIAWNDSGLDIEELDSMMSEL